MWKYSWRNIETFFPLLFPWQHSVGRIGGNFNKISWNKFRAKSRFNPAAPMPEMSPNLARRRFVPAGDALDLAWGHWEGGRAFKVDIEVGGVVVNDTLVFYLNEYFIELNQAKFKCLNQFLNWIFQEKRLLNNFLMEYSWKKLYWIFL